MRSLNATVPPAPATCGSTPTGSGPISTRSTPPSIIACRYDEEQGTLEPFQVVSALPDDYFDVNTMTSELVVHPDGKYLYISNRRVNNLGAFSIDQETGRLTPVGWVPAAGRSPGSSPSSGRKLPVQRKTSPATPSPSSESMRRPAPWWILGRYWTPPHPFGCCLPILSPAWSSSAPRGRCRNV